MNNKECVDILNGILLRMNCTGFSFDIDCDYICIKLLHEKSFVCKNRQYETYRSWKTIDDMFDSFTHLYSVLLEDRKLTHYRLWVYDVINENGFQFLEIASECSSLEELELKLQIMGYCDESN